jgi:hypothetical protein
MTPADGITIDLRGRYARVFAAHVLAGVASDVATEVSAEGLGSDEPPAVDRMILSGFHEMLDPFLERLDQLTRIAEALRVVADENEDSMVWPLAKDEQNGHDCALLLRESIGELPASAGRLVQLAGAIAPAEAFMASLQDEGGA